MQLTGDIDAHAFYSAACDLLGRFHLSSLVLRYGLRLFVVAQFLVWPFERRIEPVPDPGEAPWYDPIARVIFCGLTGPTLILLHLSVCTVCFSSFCFIPMAIVHYEVLFCLVTKTAPLRIVPARYNSAQARNERATGGEEGEEETEVASATAEWDGETGALECVFASRLDLRDWQWRGLGIFTLCASLNSLLFITICQLTDALDGARGGFLGVAMFFATVSVATLAHMVRYWIFRIMSLGELPAVANVLLSTAGNRCQARQGLLYLSDAPY